MAKTPAKDTRESMKKTQKSIKLAAERDEILKKKKENNL